MISAIGHEFHVWFSVRMKLEFRTKAILHAKTNKSNANVTRRTSIENGIS